MHLYDFKVTVTPAVSEFNSRNFRPTTSISFVRMVRSKEDAVKRFIADNFVTLRANGIVRGKKQVLDMMTVERVDSHEVTEYRWKKARVK